MGNPRIQKQKRNSKRSRKTRSNPLVAFLCLPVRLVGGIYRWVMEPIAYKPKLATEAEIKKVLEDAAESKLEKFYLQVMARSNPLEIIAHIEQLKKKIIHDKEVLASEGKGKFAKEYKERYEFISACLLEHRDTVKALEARLAEIKAYEAKNPPKLKRKVRAAHSFPE